MMASTGAALAFCLISAGFVMETRPNRKVMSMDDGRTGDGFDCQNHSRSGFSVPTSGPLHAELEDAWRGLEEHIGQPF